MDYHGAVLQAKLRKISGALLSLAAMLSTGISLMRLVYFGIDKQTQIGNVSFFKNAVFVVYDHTRFLDWFWKHCPKPDLANLKAVENIVFLLIYYAIFIGLAVYASGREIRIELDEIEDFTGNHLFSKSNPAETEIDPGQVEKAVTVSEPSILSHFIPLYILPVIVTIAGGFLLKLMGFF